MKLKYNVPEAFFQPETRQGHYVSAQMKQAWAVQLDLLQEFMRVCHEHQLRFFMLSGSLLGAIRHKGYIPWDDDIDVVMMRDDYDKLMQYASDFKEPFFLQNIFTDEGYQNRHSQLRMSGTLALAHGEQAGRRYHQGIFLDIFVMDAMPNAPRAYKHHYARISRSKLRLKLIYRLMSRLPLAVYRWCRNHTHRLSDKYLYKKYEDLLRSVPITDRTCSVALICQNMSMTVFPLSAFSETLMVPFEYLQVPIPVGYDQMLRMEYGDYMTPVKGTALHGSLCFTIPGAYNPYDDRTDHDA